MSGLQGNSATPPPFPVRIIGTSPVNGGTKCAIEPFLDIWKIKKGDVVVDAGAGDGMYTFPALDAGASKVIAIDHSPGNILKDKSKNYRKRLQIIDITVTDYDSLKTFTIDSLGLKKLDWIKIDVEGEELHVLKGGIKTIKKCKPTILLEIHHKVAGYPTNIENNILDFLKTSKIKYDLQRVWLATSGDTENVLITTK